MIENLSLGMMLDIVILVLLLATIIYAVRLTAYLKKFKDSRSDLEGVIKDLSVHVNKAEKAMADLNDAVDISSHDLKDRMNSANKMFDELEMVIQTGDALANRLESLAVRNRKIIEGGEGDVADLMRHNLQKLPSYETRLENIVKTVDAVEEPEGAARPVFSIRDPEIERGEPSLDAGFTMEDDDILSDAERDLYEALKNNKKTSKGR
tara:strand:+ start:1650 stop:2273 length:624 start_codon:yes stop_codon:yes gene_type:complete